MTHPLQPPGRPFTVLGAMLFSALVWTACTPSSTAPAPEPSTAQSTASESSTAQPTTPKPALSDAERAERARKSREAFDQIAKIWMGASIYFADPKWDPANPQRLLPCQYPNSVTCTPAIEACALPGKRYAYAPLKKDANGKWRVESSTGGLHPFQTWTQWASLSFEIYRDHYYQYCFESSGTNGDAVLKITAIGDLDCDGVKSTFIREGWAAEDSRPPDKCVSAGFKDTQINPLE